MASLPERAKLGLHKPDPDSDVAKQFIGRNVGAVE
jgi:hypothetical protein